MVIFIKNHPFLIVISFLFALLAILVTSGSTIQFDEAGVLLLRTAGDTSVPIGGEARIDFVYALTHLGDSKTLAVITILIVGYLFYAREYVAAKWFLIAAAGSFIITALSKYFFGRDRPDIVEQFATATSGSFPSGHTLRSAVVYALISYLLMQTRFFDQKKIIGILTLAVIAVNGVTRVYLGVHWPTDIIGAWLIAIFWLLLCKKGYDRACIKSQEIE
ncbi:phosphatase PAP2 family protein [Kordiimonas aquimaris]|uniref:phosphatase PAP2 family protein n=1 Tax=Kordiimonas aquimaris TaxID=707591 RepID=UPI0021CE5A5D|nr:phosphatase PAP2 family protein [Kordiimonas aquimaris]